MVIYIIMEEGGECGIDRENIEAWMKMNVLSLQF